MSTNLPSSFNFSLNSSSHHIYDCFGSEVARKAFLFLICSYFLLFFPLTIFILHLGVQRCRMQSAASAPMDVFTYNMVVIELIGMVSFCLFMFGDTPQIKMVGAFFFGIVQPAQVLFHLLTCLERYIAVVHPVLYLSLRKSVCVRNGSVGFIWVAVLGWLGLTVVCGSNFSMIPFVVLMTPSFAAIAFFSVFVLHALIRLGPGERGRDRERVAQSKRRAVHTIMVITGVLLLRFVGQFVLILFSIFMVKSDSSMCAALLSGIYFCVPSSYILPLLFLHRAGKLPCFAKR